MSRVDPTGRSDRVDVRVDVRAIVRDCVARAVDAALGEVARQQAGIAEPTATEARHLGRDEGCQLVDAMIASPRYRTGPEPSDTTGAGDASAGSAADATADELLARRGNELSQRLGDAQRDLVRVAGEQLGYGRVMRLCEEIWREGQIAHGLPGGEELSVGAPAGSLVPCPCPAGGRDAGGRCGWCGGAGRVSEWVEFAARAYQAQAESSARMDALIAELEDKAPQVPVADVELSPEMIDALLDDDDHAVCLPRWRRDPPTEEEASRSAWWWRRDAATDDGAPEVWHMARGVRRVFDPAAGRAWPGEARPGVEWAPCPRPAEPRRGVGRGDDARDAGDGHEAAVAATPDAGGGGEGPRENPGIVALVRAHGET